MSRLWAALVKAEDSKTKQKVKELEQKIKFMERDIYSLMEFLEKDANDDWNRPGSGRIMGELASRRMQANDWVAYSKARSIVREYEEDHPEVKDRNDL